MAQLLRVKDVLESLKISVVTLHRLRKAGDFPAVIRVGGSIRFDSEEILRWIADKKATPELG